MAFQKVMISGINTSELTVLKEEEKIALLREIRDTGSKAARDKLIQGNLRLVLSVIQRFTGRGEDIDLTDNKGRTVDFRNTIIIMTSNMGSQVIQDNFAEAFDGRKLPEEVVERTRLAVIDLLKQQLKPEFLNRIDEIVMFEPLTHKDIERIVDIQLGIVRRMLSENGIRLEYSDKAREWIASAGYDPLYGARPVKRVIQRYVVNDLSKRILAGEVDRSKPIAIDAGQDGLTFSN